MGHLSPLHQKLGLKAGMRCFVYCPPSHYFDLISPLPDDIEFTERCSGMLNFIHLFVRDNKTFEKQFSAAKKHMLDDSMLWISWPKKSSGVKTDIDENIIREYGLHKGLVDVKVCAIDATWSALKFVYRLKDRAH
jgi:hypothetical protein